MANYLLIVTLMSLMTSFFGFSFQISKINRVFNGYTPQVIQSSVYALDNDSSGEPWAPYFDTNLFRTLTEEYFTVNGWDKKRLEITYDFFLSDSSMSHYSDFQVHSRKAKVTVKASMPMSTSFQRSRTFSIVEG